MKNNCPLSPKRLFYLLMAIFLFGFTPAWSQQAKTPKADSKTTPSSEKNVDQLEQDLNQLKEDVFRSKARTSLLEEFLANTYLEIHFKNKIGKDFELASAVYLLDNAEMYKKEFAPGEEIPETKKKSLFSKKTSEKLIFSGITTPGRHEISLILVFRGTKTGGHTHRDYEHQLHEDFAFVASRGEMNTITITAEDKGFISKDMDRTPSHYKILLDFKIETQRLAQIRKRLERRKFGVQIESGILFDSYQIVSDFLNINQQTSALIPVGVRGQWWFHPNLGFETYYYFATWDAGSAISPQDLHVTMNWFGLDGRFRYQFGHSIYNPEIGFRTGFNFLDQSVSNNPLPTYIRLSGNYKYIDIGIDAKIPVTWNFGFQGNFLYFPWVDFDERPLESAQDSINLALEGNVGVYYNFWKNFSLLFNYKFLFIENKFAGQGTRTSINGIPLRKVETQNLIQGPMLGIKYEF